MKILNELIKKLEIDYKKQLGKLPSNKEMEKCIKFQKRHNMEGNEIYSCPETWYYEIVLERLSKDDIVFDVGAGNLVFDLMMLKKVRKVYAIEINPTTIADSLKVIGYGLPKNLIVICADAFDLGIPADVTKITSLFIHNQREFPGSWKRYKIIDAREFVKK